MYFWSGGRGIITEVSLYCVYVLCTVITVHSGTSSSYTSVFMVLYTLCPQNETLVILNILYSCKSTAMKIFFSNRVIDRWNSLDQDTVDALGLNCFKNRLNKIRCTRMGFPLNPRPCHVGWSQDKAAQDKHKVITMRLTPAHSNWHTWIVQRISAQNLLTDLGRKISTVSSDDREALFCFNGCQSHCNVSMLSSCIRVLSGVMSRTSSHSSWFCLLF